jgi:GT2 family glycosyltransferase
MSSPDVSVVVCAFTVDRAERLALAVASVQRQDPPPAEIIVVCDHAPALRAWVAAHLPDVVLLDNVHARGLSGARNTGFAAARGSIVAFLDDDAAAEPEWLARLVAAYDDARVVAAGGAVLPDWSGDRPPWLPEEFQWVVGCSYRGMPDTASPVRNLIGANMSFRRTALDRVDGFAENLGRVGSTPLGCEETELCIRLQTAHPDGVILYDPRIAVRHHVTPERASLSYFLARCRAEGISKAEVSRRAGRRDGLASERTYATRTLPRGVVTALREGAYARAGAVVLGLAATTVGYATGAAAR